MNKKVIIFFVLSLLFPIYLSSAPLVWLSWDEGVKEATKTGKPIMLEAMSSSCHYCIKMQKEVFDDSEMAVLIQEHYIPVRVNVTKTEMPFGIRVKMTPTFYFFSSKLKRLRTIRGTWNQEDFIDILLHI